MYKKFDTLTIKAINFYKKKEPTPPYTKEFMSKYRQEEGGYIVFANKFILTNDKSIEELEDVIKKKKDGHLENIIEMRKLIEQGKLGKVYSLEELDESFICCVKDDKSVGEPNQKWHFLVSYCAQYELEDMRKGKSKPTANIFNRSITCPELWLWLIEVAQDDNIITGGYVEEVYNEAINYKKKGHKEGIAEWNKCLESCRIKVEIIIKGMYIVASRILNKRIDNRYYLKLNRKSSCLEIYEKTDTKVLWDNYPIRKDFDASDYVMYEFARSMPCIFGGDGKTLTPAGIFNIEKVSSTEYISTYHPDFEQVKFYGYLVVFEDYFIHSDIYLMDANADDFREKESISLHDEHTSGCVRVSQDDLYWLIENIPEGTTIEM
ncbi:MAG TPA: L,D-transpeptidase [Lachnospiraceae bacterium]|nr:L,D-transpeptidase [Lachnospiraceae bacterium]